MKYTIVLDSNPGFVQITGFSEWGKHMEYPMVFQIRGDERLLETMGTALERYLSRASEIEESFHDDENARRDFDKGFVIAEFGEHPVVIVAKQRTMSMMIGETQFGSGQVQEPANLLDAIRQLVGKPKKAKSSTP